MSETAFHVRGAFNKFSAYYRKRACRNAKFDLKFEHPILRNKGKFEFKNATRLQLGRL